MKRIYLSEFSKRFSINELALRYYDSKNLFLRMKKYENNYRFIYEKDILYINIVICLKKTGMSLENISHYLELIEKGLESGAYNAKVGKQMKFFKYTRKFRINVSANFKYYNKCFW